MYANKEKNTSSAYFVEECEAGEVDRPVFFVLMVEEWKNEVEDVKILNTLCGTSVRFCNAYKLQKLRLIVSKFKLTAISLNFAPTSSAFLKDLGFPTKIIFRTFEIVKKTLSTSIPSFN